MEQIRLKLKIPVKYKNVSRKFTLPINVIAALDCLAMVASETDDGDKRTLSDRILEGIVQAAIEKEGSAFKALVEDHLEKLIQKEKTKTEAKKAQSEAKDEKVKHLIATEQPKPSAHADAAAVLTEHEKRRTDDAKEMMPQNDAPQVPVPRGNLPESGKQPRSENTESGQKPDREPAAAAATMPIAPEKDPNAACETEDDIAETWAEKSSGHLQEKGAKGDRDSRDISGADDGGNGKDGKQAIDPQATNPEIKEIEHLFDVS